MSARDASELFLQMDQAVERARHLRRSTSTTSPQLNNTVEAEPGCVFTMRNLIDNVPTQRPVSLSWALANVLHFFTGTEDASMLGRYNKHADRFAPLGWWKGAYGALAIPQLHDVIDELKMHPDSRRAIVSMGQMQPMDINRPACWNHLHFLKWGGKLDMLVEQRSLMLHGVMAYDTVVLTNVLFYMACATGMQPGAIRWRVGSLHKLETHKPILEWSRPESLLLPYSVMRSPAECLAWLREPETALGVFRDILMGTTNATPAS